MARWIALGLGVLLVGIGVGSLLWGRPTRAVTHQVIDLQTRLTEQERRADELQSKLTGTEAELGRAMEGLKQERALREQFEDMVNKGRK